MPGVSIEEAARPLKRLKVGGKGKEKVGSSIWSDAETAVDRVNEFFTLREMKEISSTPSHEMVSRHVHKLVQVIFPVLVSRFFFLTPRAVSCLLGVGRDDAYYDPVPGKRREGRCGQLQS